MSSDWIEASREARALVEEASVVMPFVRRSRYPWAVVLAGGNGSRLQNLTRKIPVVCWISWLATTFNQSGWAVPIDIKRADVTRGKISQPLRQ
jgi:hypothetical protein